MLSAYGKTCHKTVITITHTLPPHSVRCSSSFAKACLENPGAMTLSSWKEFRRSSVYSIELLTEAGQYPLLRRSFESGVHLCWHVWHLYSGWCKSKRPWNKKVNLKNNIYTFTTYFILQVNSFCTLWMVERHCVSSYNPSIALILLEKCHAYILYICLIHQIPDSCVNWTSCWKDAKDVTALRQLTIFCFCLQRTKIKRCLSFFRLMSIPRTLTGTMPQHTSVKNIKSKIEI